MCSKILSNNGQRNAFREMAKKDFEYDLQHGYLPPEKYASLSTPEKYKKFEAEFFNTLAKRQSEDGVSFRKAFNIPNDVTDPDMIQNTVERGGSTRRK